MEFLLIFHLIFMLSACRETKLIEEKNNPQNNIFHTMPLEDGINGLRKENKFVQVSLSNVEGNEEFGDIIDLAAVDNDFFALTDDNVLMKLCENGKAIPMATFEERPKALFYVGDTLVITFCESNMILYSNDLKNYYKSVPGEKLNPNSFCKYGRTYFAISDNTVYMSEDLVNWENKKLPLSGEIIKMVAGDTRCMGITNKSEIFYTEDCIHWHILNYEERYNKKITFEQLVYGGFCFNILGKNPDGSSEIIFSTEGEVWSERPLEVFNESEIISILLIKDIFWAGEQLNALCESGRLLVMPDCVKCNKFVEIEGGEILDICATNNKIGVLFYDQKFSVIDADETRQFNTSAQDALARQNAGAVIIDVRDVSDYEEKHIKGSVSIPLAELENKLKLMYPETDTEIVFYCSTGVRSTKAIKVAMSLGYTNVYNLGSIENWCYDFE